MCGQDFIYITPSPGFAQVSGSEDAPEVWHVMAEMVASLYISANTVILSLITKPGAFICGIVFVEHCLLSVWLYLINVLFFAFLLCDFFMSAADYTLLWLHAAADCALLQVTLCAQFLCAAFCLAHVSLLL